MAAADGGAPAVVDTSAAAAPAAPGNAALPEAPECSAEAEDDATSVGSSEVAPAAGRSDWGLFACARRDEAGGAQVLTYAMEPPRKGCEAAVAVVKPITGAGTALMHGDFARRASPSLEALSWRVATRRKLFKGKRVLELGAGLGLTGLACAAWTEAEAVDLTDGDPAVVATLQRSIRLNEASGVFGETRVRGSLLHWDTSGASRSELSEQYDIILAGDTVYQVDSHTAQLATMRRWLKPAGMVLMMASTRNGSLHKFVEQAKQLFPVVKSSTTYDSTITATFTAGKVKMKCFPWMVRLRNIVEPEPAQAFTSLTGARYRAKAPPPPQADDCSVLTDDTPTEEAPVPRPTDDSELAEPVAVVSSWDMGRGGSPAEPPPPTAEAAAPIAPSAVLLPLGLRAHPYATQWACPSRPCTTGEAEVEAMPSFSSSVYSGRPSSSYFQQQLPGLGDAVAGTAERRAGGGAGGPRGAR